RHCSVRSGIRRGAGHCCRRPGRSACDALCVRGLQSHSPLVPSTDSITGSMRFVIIGGSDAGISAALRARELDSSAQITVVLADAFPNYSICGLPFYLSGETPDWHQLAHRTEFEGIEFDDEPCRTSV